MSLPLHCRVRLASSARGRFPRNLSELGRARSACPRQPARRDSRLYQSGAEKVSTALRDDIAIHGAGFVAHSARQISEPQSQPAPIEVGLHHAIEDALELAHSGVLPSPVTKVLPRRMSWTD